MSVKSNGTHAKDIALHFLNVTDQKATKAIMAKTIMQAKSILSSDYTKEEIIGVIDAIIKKGANMYSLGYVASAMNDVLRELRASEDAERNRELAQQAERDMAQSASEKWDEVAKDDESSERNRAKAGRFGVQSRFGKKHNFDLFEGHRENH